MDQPSTVELKSDDQKLSPSLSLIEYRELRGLNLGSLSVKSGSKRPLSSITSNTSVVTEPPVKIDKWNCIGRFGFTRAMEAEREKMVKALNLHSIDVISDKILVTKECLSTLIGYNEWLDGQVIDWYNQHTLEQIKNPRIFAYRSYDYKYNRKVMLPTDNIDPFAYDTLFVPVWENIPDSDWQGVHWILIVIRIKDKTVQLYDSNLGAYPEVIDKIVDYLVERAKDNGYKNYSKRENWTKVTMTGIPKQVGSQNCGVFVCQYIAFLAKGVPLNFVEKDMINFRKAMQHEILMYGKRQDEMNKILSDAFDSAQPKENADKVSRAKKSKNAITCPDKVKSNEVSKCSSYELFDIETEHDAASPKPGEASASSPSSLSTSVAPFELDLDPTVSSNSCSSLASSCNESFMLIDSSLSPMDTSFEANADHISAPNTPMSMDLDIGLGSPTSLSSFSSVDNSSNESFDASSPREESPVPDNGYFSTGSQSPSVNDPKSSAKLTAISSSSSASSYNEMDIVVPKSIDDYMAKLPTCCLPADLPDVTIPRQMELEKTGLKHAVHSRDILLKGVDDVIGDYQTGDLVMAKHQDGGWATWPGLVVPYPYKRKSKDPKPHGYRRKAPYPVRYARLDKGTKAVTQYAIQFLGSEQLVDWIDVEKIDAYLPYEEYKENVLKPRLVNAEDKALFVLNETPKTSEMEAWREANYEAEQLIGMSRKERLGYTHMYVSKWTGRTVTNQVQSGQDISN